MEICQGEKGKMNKNNTQRKKENTALSEGSLETRSSLDNTTKSREKGAKDVDNYAEIMIR